MNILRAVPFFIFAFAVLWYGALALRFPTAGAIGADPATYVQMALDLAQRGTVVHEFPLFTKLFNQNLSWDAFITPGYHIVPESGFVAPNFAFGFPLLLAFAYRVFGENALYWTTPLLGALSLIMTFALANELFRDISTTRRYWIGALAALLLATSPKQIQLALVPMSDVPTQLFCVLAVWCALRAMRTDVVICRFDLWDTDAADFHRKRNQISVASVRSVSQIGVYFKGFLPRPRNEARGAADNASAWKPVTVHHSFRYYPRITRITRIFLDFIRVIRVIRGSKSLENGMRCVRSLAYATLCGLSLGIAYLIRHSALVMLVPLALVAMRWGNTRREKIFLIAAALCVFAITIAPDIFYRARVLGSPFAVESPESAQTNFYDAPRQILQMLAALFSVTGFGPLILFAPFGWWILAREKKRFAAGVLAAWVLAFLFLHAPLTLTGVFENDLRYLIPAYPALALSASAALVWIFGRAWNEMRATQTRFAKQSLIVYAIALFGIFALAIALRAMPNPERFALRAYGWMSETARNDLRVLNEQLPRDAVIGASDQMAGATLLYAQREIFRPANFLEPAREFPQFLQEMKDEKRAVFLLGDWKCSALATASEKLPNWLADYSFVETKISIFDLPYECPQNLYKLEGE